MKVPFKVSTTTSNFMIGVTAVASAVVYIQRGYIAQNSFPNNDRCLGRFAFWCSTLEET